MTQATDALPKSTVKFVMMKNRAVPSPRKDSTGAMSRFHADTGRSDRVRNQATTATDTSSMRMTMVKVARPDNQVKISATGSSPMTAQTTVSSRIVEVWTMEDMCGERCVRWTARSARGRPRLCEMACW